MKKRDHIMGNNYKSLKKYKFKQNENFLIF